MLNTFYASKNSNLTKLLENKPKNLQNSPKNIFQKNPKIKPTIAIINDQKKIFSYLSSRRKKLETKKPKAPSQNNLHTNGTLTNKINMFYENEKFRKSRNINSFSSTNSNNLQNRGITPNNINHKVNIQNSTKNNFFHFNLFENKNLHDRFTNFKKDSYEYFPDIRSSNKNNIDINYNKHFKPIQYNIAKNSKHNYDYHKNIKEKRVNHNRKYVNFIKENNKNKLKISENENSNPNLKIIINENINSTILKNGFGNNKKTITEYNLKNISKENESKSLKSFSRDRKIEPIKNDKKPNDTTINENENKDQNIENFPHVHIFNYYNDGVYLMKEPEKTNNKENPMPISTESIKWDTNNINNGNTFDNSIEKNNIEKNNIEKNNIEKNNIDKNNIEKNNIENNENKKSNITTDPLKIDHNSVINDDINQKNEKKQIDDKINNKKVINSNFNTSSFFYNKDLKNNFNVKNNLNDKNQKNTENDQNTEQKQDLNDIIKRVIENNKRAAAAKTSTCFFNIGINYMNNRARRTGSNFFANFQKKFPVGENTNNEPKKYLNSIKLTLENPEIWKKHEIVWKNIKKFNEKDCEFLLPPNDNDALISCYLNMYPQKLDLNSKNKDKKEDIFSFVIDDSIHNPTNEIQKWKSAHRKLILKWHPDKLFPLLKELKINEELKNELKKKSTIIIDNINKVFQNVMEILRKILLAKEEKDKNN